MAFAFDPITNANLWDALRAKFPQFASHTSKATASMFTETGYTALKNSDPDALNDFFGLSLRVFLQMVNASRAEDTLSRDGFGEYFEQPYGGYIQRMSINSLKPVSPGYIGLKDGDSPDPFVVRKPKANERIFKQNFSYQSLLTMPDEDLYKNMFVSEFGMSEYFSGCMTSLENGYTVQLFENKLEAINAGINSVDYPLLDTQKVQVTFDLDDPEKIRQLILEIKNVVSAMTMGPQSSAFNAAGFATMQDKDRLVLLVRPGVKNAIEVNLLSDTYNPENLTLPVKVVTVPSFGGLIPYASYDQDTGIYSDILYPVYDTLGSVIGFNTVADQTTVTVQENEVYWKDPNADVVGLIADKGWLFYSQQNPYTIQAIRNPRGLYTNFWANSANNAVCIDHIYNCVELYTSKN